MDLPHIEAIRKDFYKQKNYLIDENLLAYKIDFTRNFDVEREYKKSKR